MSNVQSPTNLAEKANQFYQQNGKKFNEDLQISNIEINSALHNTSNISNPNVVVPSASPFPASRNPASVLAAMKPQLAHQTTLYLKKKKAFSISPNINPHIQLL
jgi:hypothetical protein